MKLSRVLAPVILVFILALGFVSSGAAQTTSAPQPFPFKVGLTWPAVTAGSGSIGAFDVAGLQYFSVDWVVSGTVSACSVTLDGNSSIGGAFSTGSIVSSQSCTSTGTFTTSSASMNIQAQLSYSITGSGSVTFTVRGFSLNPASSSGSAACVTTVSGLNSCPGQKNGTLATVTDGTSATDCSTGGGSHVVACQNNGTSGSPSWGFAGGTGTGLPTATAAAQVPTSTGPGTTYNAAFLGVVPRASACTGNVDTILATDRGNYVSENDASACAVTLPQAGSTGFANNFYFTIKNIGAGTVTLTPTTSTIDGNASLTINGNSVYGICSDNTNYFSCAAGASFPDFSDATATKLITSVPFTFSANGSVPSGSPTAIFRKSSSVVCASLGFGDACDFALDATAGYRIFSSGVYLWSTSGSDATSGIRSALNSLTAGVVNVGASTVAGDIQGTMQASTLSVADDGNASGSAQISFGSKWQVTSKACETSYGITTVNTSSATTTTGQNCLPANAIIDSVVYRVTTAITTATSFTVGVSGSTSLFCGTQSTLTLGATGACQNQTGSSLQLNVSAAPVVVTFNATPGAGAMRIIVFYRTGVAPTS